MTYSLCSAAGVTWTYDNKFLTEKCTYLPMALLPSMDCLGPLPSRCVDVWTVEVSKGEVAPWHVINLMVKSSAD